MLGKKTKVNKNSSIEDKYCTVGEVNKNIARLVN